MNRILTLAFAALTTTQALAQFNATITVTDAGTSAPLENATVQLDGNALTTDALGQAVFTGLADGTYDYTVSLACYTSGAGSITIAGADASSPLALQPMVANNVFFFIGSPFALIGANVNLTDGADFNVSFVTWDTWGGEMVADVPFGEYSYTISKPCYETITGTVVVDCNNGDGIAVVAEPAEANNVFFFIGSLLAITGATVEVTNGAGYDTTFVTWSPWGGEMVGDMPFGDYSFTVTAPCYETATGDFTVHCNNEEGIAVLVDPVAIQIDASVTVDGAVLTATASGMDYQWVDCGNNLEPIAGAVSQSFQPVQSGDYAVIITSGDCSVTSACTAVVVTSTAELVGDAAFSVHPNPFQDQLIIGTGAQAGPVRVQLFNADGRLVLEEARSNGERIILRTAQLPAGSYALRILGPNASKTLLVVR